jgi:methylthioribose-1-phosphate isomerase
MKRHIKYSESEQALFLLDQRHLPHKESWFVCRRVKDVVYGLQKMVVRGAPAIGITAAYGCALATLSLDAEEPDWQEQLEEKLYRMANARPTAVNLSYVVERMHEAWEADPEIGLEDLHWMWLRLAKEIHSEDIAANKALGKHGLELIRDKRSIMTHCNAGALATGGYGTALGVVRAAKSAGLDIQVIANETRPFFQGARLTAYELQQDDIPVRVACDNAAALLMKKGLVEAVLVGADRIVANGDTANKIGTYNLALLARQHGIPFYVAAPSSTFDAKTPSGESIPIESRSDHEVTHIKDHQITPSGVPVYNYAFDVTPSSLIDRIICERGVLSPPFGEEIAKVVADR